MLLRAKTARTSNRKIITTAIGCGGAVFSSKREGGGGVLGSATGPRYASFTTFAWPVVHRIVASPRYCHSLTLNHYGVVSAAFPSSIFENSKRRKEKPGKIQKPRKSTQTCKDGKGKEEEKKADAGVHTIRSVSGGVNSVSLA